MTDIILPAFIDFPEEGAIIGRLLAGYGELEFDAMVCVGTVISDHDVALKTMFRARGEKTRIDIADALGRRAYRNLGLENQFSEAIAAVQFCRRIRNQFAHCHWHNDLTGKLSFVRLTEIAGNNIEADLSNLTIHYVDVPLLELQETYFKFASRWLTYLNFEARKLAGSVATHPFEAPKKIDRPELYIP